MSNENRKPKAPVEYRDPLHPERKLVSRRDFLKSGLIGLSGAAMMPSIVDIVVGERLARAGETDGRPLDMMPFLVFDCAGGAALAGNWVPSLQEGNPRALLPSYNMMGLANQTEWEPDFRFGAGMAKRNLTVANGTMFSEIFETLTNPWLDPTANPPMQPNPFVLPDEIQRCLKMTVIAHTSLSDSSMNALSAVSMVTASGAVGSRIRGGLGNQLTVSGGNSQAASLDPYYRPMGIRSVDGLAAALSYGPAFAGLPVRMKDALARALIKMSASQGRLLANLNLGQQFAALSQQAFNKNLSYTSDGNSVDPRTDPVMQSIYGITPASNGSSGAVVTATLVKNALEGVSGPAVITIGGCDYHDGSNATGANKNVEIGQHLSRAIRAAWEKARVTGKPMAFQIITDGGISSRPAVREWVGDDNDKGLTVFGVLDPSGQRTDDAMIRAAQIGNYVEGQGANRRHYLGVNPDRVAHAVFLNYLAVNGRMQDYAKVATGRERLLPVGDARAMDSLLMFRNFG